MYFNTLTFVEFVVLSCAVTYRLDVTILPPREMDDPSAHLYVYSTFSVPVLWQLFAPNAIYWWKRREERFPTDTYVCFYC